MGIVHTASSAAAVAVLLGNFWVLMQVVALCPSRDKDAISEATLLLFSAR